MSRMKGPAIFLAQFAGDEAPFDTLPAITKWAGDLGYVGVQVPTWVDGFIDLEKAAESKDYCDELKGICAERVQARIDIPLKPPGDWREDTFPRPLPGCLPSEWPKRRNPHSEVARREW